MPTYNVPQGDAVNLYLTPYNTPSGNIISFEISSRNYQYISSIEMLVLLNSITNKYNPYQGLILLLNRIGQNISLTCKVLPELTEV